MISIDFSKYRQCLEKDYIRYIGKVSKVVGLTIEAIGPEVGIGETCIIESGRTSNRILAEVVGFKDNKVLLMPIGDMNGITPGSRVIANGEQLKVNVSSSLLGRVLDGLGNVIDNKGPLTNTKAVSVNNEPPDPMQRERINEVLPLGVKSIDSMLTVGKGQRVGIFAGSGVGKSTLMGMIARNTKADVNIIALIGERGREVKEFIERDLQQEGLNRSVVIVATSDKPALIRQKAAFLATAVAEYFRDEGKDVLLLMDSLTRFSMAQREIGLAIGEPPVSRGYTPSVFSMMPKLLERAGKNDKGSITGLYTVLVDGDDLTEPVTDTARGILDGHIVLSRDLANKSFYPAIDVLGSISRVMSDIVDENQKKLAKKIRKVLAIYRESEDLINIGAYVKGSSKDIDYAISVINKINTFLMQETLQKFDYDKTLELMQKLF